MTKQGFGKLISLQEAVTLLTRLVKEKEDEETTIQESLGRIVAKDVKAPMNVPSFEKSAMDGFAVKAEDTFDASQTKPITLEIIESITAGQIAKNKPGQGQCIEITTGAPVPKGADAVVMVEHTEKNGKEVTIYKGVAPKENVIKIGSDVKEGEAIIKKGTRLSSRTIGVLSALGLSNVAVKKRPFIAYFSTGNEITPLGKKLEQGKIYDINTATITAAIKEEGCELVDLGLIKDDLEEIKRAIKEGVSKADFLLLSGGSSLGGEDYMVEAVAQLGKVLVHGIAVKPGKPVLIGEVQGKAVLGLPGYPTSALSNFYILVQPLIDGMQGLVRERDYVEAKLSRKVASTIGRYEFLAVRTEEKAGELIATPVMKGSSSITTLAQANGFVEIGENTEVLNKDDKVRVRRFTR